MTREELAARIFVTQLCDDDCGLDALCSWSFDMADTFLAYAAKEREKAAPPPDHDCDGYKCEHISHYPERCNHNWCSINGGPTHCLHCGAPKVQPEPPKPERVARTFWLTHWMNGDIGEPVYVVDPGKPGGEVFEYIKVRQILPGDEHDKR